MKDIKTEKYSVTLRMLDGQRSTKRYFSLQNRRLKILNYVMAQLSPFVDSKNLFVLNSLSQMVMKPAIATRGELVFAFLFPLFFIFRLYGEKSFSKAKSME